MSRLKAAGALCLIVATVFASTAPIGTDDTELRDLDLTGWDCANQFDGTEQSQEARERNRMKNRWPVDLSLFTVEPLDTAGFLEKVREFESHPLRSLDFEELMKAGQKHITSWHNKSTEIRPCLPLSSKAFNHAFFSCSQNAVIRVSILGCGERRNRLREVFQPLT